MILFEQTYAWFVSFGPSRTPVPTGTHFISPYPLVFIFSPAIASFEPRDYLVVFVLQATARTDFGTGGFVYNSIMINGRDTPFIIGFIGDRLLVRSSKIERTTLRRE